LRTPTGTPGAVTYYLAHRDEVDRYLSSRREDFEAASAAARDAGQMFYRKLTDAKRDTRLSG